MEICLRKEKTPDIFSFSHVFQNWLFLQGHLKLGLYDKEFTTWQNCILEHLNRNFCDRVF